MARTNNLNDFLTDVADSIRAKTGKTDKISAASFDTEIEGITAGEDLSEELNAYDTSLTTQETSIQDIIKALDGKAAGGDGGGDNGGGEKINPTSISFVNSTATTLGGFEHLDTSNIRDMNKFFYNCKKLTSLDLKRLDVSNVTNMNEMFSGCSVLTSVDVTGWNTNNVTTMSEMFKNAMALKTLDLSSFVGTNVTSTSHMFSWCTKLTHLDMRNFDFTNVTSYSHMFDNVPSSCEIIVKDDTAKAWVLARSSDFTNVKTVAEL